MAKKKEEQVEAVKPDTNPELEAILAEMRTISPTLSELKRNNPAKYKEVYKRYLKLIEERDLLTK